MTRPKRGDEPIAVTEQGLLRWLTEEDALKTLVQTLLQEARERIELLKPILTALKEEIANRNR